MHTNIYPEMYNFNTELGTDMIYMQIANQQINMVMKKMYCWEYILKYTDGVFFFTLLGQIWLF